MEKSHIIIVLLIIIIILVMNLYNKKENITSDSGKTLSDEALQNIAKVYGDTSGTVSFNNVNITGNLRFMKGIICAWSGAIADIDTKNWGFCDGTTYKALDGSDLKSPDLRSAFIMGASKPNTPTGRTVVGPTGQPIMQGIAWLTPQEVGKYGGEEKHTLTIAEIPPHRHAASKSCMGSDPAGDWSTYTDLRSTHGWNCVDRTSNPLWTNFGNDTSSLTSLGGGAHNNMPPYYALAYIIKL